MLDAFIIDELRRKEKAERAADDNRLYIPAPDATDGRRQAPERRPQNDGFNGFEMPSQPVGEAIVIDL